MPEITQNVVPVTEMLIYNCHAQSKNLMETVCWRIFSGWYSA